MFILISTKVTTHKIKYFVAHVHIESIISRPIINFADLYIYVISFWAIKTLNPTKKFKKCPFLVLNKFQRYNFPLTHSRRLNCKQQAQDQKRNRGSEWNQAWGSSGIWIIHEPRGPAEERQHPDHKAGKSNNANTSIVLLLLWNFASKLKFLQVF